MTSLPVETANEHLFLMSSNETQEKNDHGGNVTSIVDTVTLWNKSPDKLHFIEWLNHLGRIKQDVAKVSLDPQVWPNQYLSQSAIQSFLRLVVEKCIQHSSSECISTAEIRVAVKEVIEPIDLDELKDLPFRKHISKWIYNTVQLPIAMDCRSMMSLQKYFQYGLDHMHGESSTTTQSDMSLRVSQALAKVIFCFTSHLHKALQRYEETFVVTMLLPFNYDPDKHVFSTSFSICDLQYLCKKFDYHCKEFFEVMKQNSALKSQTHLFLLGLEMHNDLNKIGRASCRVSV